MGKEFRLFPEQASVLAGEIDKLYFLLIGMSIFFALLVFFLIYIFAVRYRRRSEDEVPRQIPGLVQLEIAWSVIPFILCLGVFAWGAKLYYEAYTPPEDALEIYVVGKQWMWHLQHPTGQREINTLHVPKDTPVKLTMATEDVIHSFYIPAFRIKKDVVPGRYSTMWFQATKVGVYHLFCAEYCGAKHSAMGGSIIVMEPVEYERWLSGGGSDETPAVAGERRFQQLGCLTCHGEKPGARGPSLRGVYGSAVVLQNGQTAAANMEYLRESILQPQSKMVAGYTAIMPTYQGQISEADVLNLIAYIKSMGKTGSN